MLASDITLSDSNVEISINLNPEKPIIDIKKLLKLNIVFKKLIKETQIYLKRIKLIPGDSNIFLKNTNIGHLIDNNRTVRFEEKLEIERITYLDIDLSFSEDGVHTFGLKFEYVISKEQEDNFEERNNNSKQDGNKTKQGDEKDSEETELIVEGIKVVVYREPDLKIYLRSDHNQELQTILLNLGNNEVKIDVINKNQNLSVYVEDIKQSVDTPSVEILENEKTKRINNLISPGGTYQEIRVFSVNKIFSPSSIKTTLIYKLLFNGTSLEFKKEKTITTKLQLNRTTPQVDIFNVPADYIIAKNLMEEVIKATNNGKECKVIIYSGISRPFLTEEIDNIYREYMDTQIKMIKESKQELLSYTRYIVLGLPLINLLNLALSENNNTVQDIINNEQIKQKIGAFAEFLCRFVRLTYKPLGHKKQKIQIKIPSDPFFLGKILSLMIVSIDDMDDVIFRFRIEKSEGLVIHFRGPNLYKKFESIITKYVGELGRAKSLDDLSLKNNIKKIDETLDTAKNIIIDTYKSNMGLELREIEIEYIVTKLVDSIKEAIKKSCQSEDVH